MSKFLKAIVNIILILAILIAGGLLIPPMAGVTTVVVDDAYMNTNLPQGSVTYALNPKTDKFEKGDQVLVQKDGKQYVYTVLSETDGTYQLQDKLSVDGTTTETTLDKTAKKVLFTIPFMGYVSMALGTTEGLIIVGLGIVFVVVLFILSEIWKKDDEEDEEDEDGNEAEETDTEVPMSRREKKKAKKAARKEAKKEAKAQAKKDKKKSDKKEVKKEKKKEKQLRKDTPVETVKESAKEMPVVNPEEGKTIAIPQEEFSKIETENISETKGASDADVQNLTEEEQKLFDETSGNLAAELAVMMAEDKDMTEEETDSEKDIFENMRSIVGEDEEDEDIEAELMRVMSGSPAEEADGEKDDLNFEETLEKSLEESLNGMKAADEQEEIPEELSAEEPEEMTEEEAEEITEEELEEITEEEPEEMTEEEPEEITEEEPEEITEEEPEEITEEEPEEITEEEPEEITEEEPEEITEEELEEITEEEPEEATEEILEGEPEAEEEEAYEEGGLAMPVYTKEELKELVRKSGDDPRVVEDELSGITLFDYSDIL